MKSNIKIKLIFIVFIIIIKINFSDFLNSSGTNGKQCVFQFNQI